jgi:large subunit ribosomal protein L13
LATRIATLLQGKHKTIYQPVADCGDYVVVKNAQNLILTGKKRQDKEWIRHTGFPGGIRRTPVTKLLDLNPSDVKINFLFFLITFVIYRL